MAKCTSCNHPIGPGVLLATPPNRPFQCKHCGAWIQMNSDRALLLIVVPIMLTLLAVWKLALGEAWVLLGLPIALVAYVLFAKVEKGGK